MKIGFFTDTYEPQINGVVTSIRASIDYLEQNNEVFVFCPNVEPKIESTEKVWRFPSVIYPFQKEYRLVIPINNKNKKIESLNLDIIHIHTPFTIGHIGLKIGKNLKIPVIHTYHTYFEKYLHYFPIVPKKWVHYYAKKKSEEFCNSCDKIIVPTNEMKALLETYKINKELITIPSGIKEYKPTNNEIQKFKLEFMNPQTKNAIFVGRIGKEKNINFLIEAFKKIVLNVQSIHLTIIGDGPERKKVEQKIKKLDLDDMVTLTGYMNKKDVFKAYHAADIMLFPSITETQGLTAVESIMAGTPVIGINKMGIKNVIKHNLTGILTNDNLEEYTAAALKLIKNNNLRNEFKKNAIEHGKEFSYINTGKHLENVYKTALNEYQLRN